MAGDNRWDCPIYEWPVSQYDFVFTPRQKVTGNRTRNKMHQLIKWTQLQVLKHPKLFSSFKYHEVKYFSLSLRFPARPTRSCTWKRKSICSRPGLNAADLAIPLLCTTLPNQTAVHCTSYRHERKKEQRWRQSESPRLWRCTVTGGTAPCWGCTHTEPHTWAHTHTHTHAHRRSWALSFCRRRVFEYATLPRGPLQRNELFYGTCAF